LRRYNLATGEIHTTNAAEPVTFDPRTLLQPFNQAADDSRRQLVQARSQDAANFAGMKLLYELFTSGAVSGRDASAAYTYTFPQGQPVTSALLLSADRYLEQHAPFHLDWDAIVRGEQGTTITVRAGRDQRPAAVRSAAFRLDEQMQAAFERRTTAQATPNTAGASLLDQALLSYGDDLLAAFDAGGSGYFPGNHTQQATAYIGLNEAAASIGFRLQLDPRNRPTDAGFAYSLVPLAPGQQPTLPRTLPARQQRAGRHLPRRRGILQSPPPGNRRTQWAHRARRRQPLRATADGDHRSGHSRPVCGRAGLHTPARPHEPPAVGRSA
jgi:hypothetical protein